MDKPSALTNSQLLELFKSRGMKVEEADVDKLKHINYYMIIFNVNSVIKKIKIIKQPKSIMIILLN